MTNQMLDVMAGLFPGETAAIMYAFDMMDIADEVVQLCEAKYGKEKMAPLFGLANPRDEKSPLGQMTTVNREVYVNHIEELAERLANDGDLRKPTNAEVLCTFSHMLEQRPLTSAMQRAMAVMMKRVADDDEDGELAAVLREVDMAGYEDYTGQTDEIIDFIAGELYPINRLGLR